MKVTAAVISLREKCSGPFSSIQEAHDTYSVTGDNVSAYYELKVAILLVLKTELTTSHLLLFTVRVSYIVPSGSKSYHFIPL